MFGAAAIPVLISIFTGKDSILPSLIFVGLALGLAFFAYRRLVMGKVPTDLGLSYVACGMWPLLVSYHVLCFLLGLAIIFISRWIISAWNPMWLQTVNAAQNDLSGHGDLLVNGAPTHSFMTNFSGAIHHSGLKHHRLVLSHVASRAIIALPTVTCAVLRAKHFVAFTVREANKLPELQFQDGTNAAPLIAKFLRSLAGVPYSLFVLVSFIYVFGSSCVLQGLVFAFTLGPLKRLGATVLTVVTCSRAMIVGSTTLAFVVNRMPNVVVFAFYVIYAVFELGICTIIALSAYANKITVLPSQRKPVLIEPVILDVLYNYPLLIGVLIFFKNAMPILANVLEKVVSTTEAINAIAKWFVVILVAFIPQPVLLVYAVRIARKRYYDALSPF